MKNPIFLLSLLFFSFLIQNVSAQDKSSVKIIGDPDPWGNKDLARLANWQGIHHYKVKITGKSLNGKNYSLIAKEFWNGRLKKVDTLFNSQGSAYFGPVKGDTLPLTMMASKKSERSLRAEVFFDRVSVYHDYLTTNSDDYSMRILDRQKTELEVGKPFYLFAYIMPYEKDGNKYWCAVESSGKDIEKWGTEFGLEHYILYEMRFF